ncbi:hypothetical protein [Qipengyuania flava]|uniref:hypothetical protein n=1 Tax=Qipengyuania flava TaxID=192812 RepID=UPI001CFD3349|nr:hypothetical protein [Qipengyuania flava]
MDELDAMKAVGTSLEQLPKDAQQRVLTWAISKFAHEGSLPPAGQVAESVGGSTKPKKSTSTPKASKPGKKAKITLSMDKTLNLVPSNGPSASAFQIEKSPSSVVQKCVVAAYYLREHSNATSVTANGVYTFFKTVGWKLPTDLKNTLQQAGSKGWLDTADSENILITPIGENLIEHDLPTKAK